MWFGCHGYLKGKGQQPYLVITPVFFDKLGTIHMALTWRPEQATIRKSFRLRLGDTRLATAVLDLLSIAGVQ